MDNFLCVWSSEKRCKMEVNLGYTDGIYILEIKWGMIQGLEPVLFEGEGQLKKNQHSELDRAVKEEN